MKALTLSFLLAATLALGACDKRPAAVEVPATPPASAPSAPSN